VHHIDRAHPIPLIATISSAVWLVPTTDAVVVCDIATHLRKAHLATLYDGLVAYHYLHMLIVETKCLKEEEGSKWLLKGVHLLLLLTDVDVGNRDSLSSHSMSLPLGDSDITVVKGGKVVSVVAGSLLRPEGLREHTVVAGVVSLEDVAFHSLSFLHTPTIAGYGSEVKL
jgi:hypothetical protein